MFYLVKEINSVSVESTNGTDTVTTQINKNFNWNLNKSETDINTKFKTLFSALSQNKNFKVLMNTTIDPTLNVEAPIFDQTEFIVTASGTKSFTTTSNKRLKRVVFLYNGGLTPTLALAEPQLDIGDYVTITFTAYTNNFQNDVSAILYWITESFHLGYTSFKFKLQS